MDLGTRPATVIDLPIVAATDDVYTDPIDCLHALQVTFHLRASLEYVLDGLLCTTVQTSDQLTDTNATGRFVAAMVGMTITGTGIPGATTVSSVDGPNTITMSANATASAADVAATFTLADVGIKTITAQVRRDPSDANGWRDVADALLMQQVGGTGTTGLDDGCVVSVLPKSASYIPWSQCRLKIVGHDTLPVPALTGRSLVVRSMAVISERAEVATITI